MDMEKSLQRVSKRVVPDWNNLTAHQLGQLAQPHVQFYFPQMPVSDHRVAVHGEDTNGVHFPPPMSFPPSKPRWGSYETLESIVRQCHDVRPPKPEDSRACLQDCDGHRKVAKCSGPMHPSRVALKRRCESKPGVQGKKASARGSGATSNTREDDLNTIMTTKLAELEESFSHDESESKDEGGEAGRGEMRRSNSQSECPRQSKATTTHNISEQRRRYRINEKMKALQKLVPNSSKISKNIQTKLINRTWLRVEPETDITAMKRREHIIDKTIEPDTDKASMLDEVIAYTKQLQAQVEMMKLLRSSNINNGNNHVNIPQMMNAMMMMPAAALPPQQQLQMSLVARMGAGLGLGMLDHASNVAANNAFISPPQQLPLPPHLLLPQMIPSATFTASQLNPNVGGPLASMPLHDPYATFLAQKMSMDNYYNKLAALHQQQTRHPVLSDKT